jgi:hypothetical protein
MTSKAGKHLYGRGWLGLIPLVGAFVGIWLVILGIGKYKDKRLILIGSLAISFTILVYSSLFYVTYYSDFGRQQFAQIAGIELNRLVEKIEFFKLKNRNYPDSLEQLLEFDSSVDLYDPLSGKGGEGFKMFNYKRLGEHYTLFSSGIDKNIHTKTTSILKWIQSILG